jgi:tryptophanyl-tRNA synthetase
MTQTTILTGITTTGTPHLGNYVGAIRPAIEASKQKNVSPFYFLADYHALIKCNNPEKVHQSSLEIAATWLALGLDTNNATFYRQSDVPEIMELSWMLTCVTAKGLMNRSHAYKAMVAENDSAASNDTDKGITMGLFSYPILMAADILIFNAHKVPVGKDQIQHIEMARDIASRFNHIYGEYFTLPKAIIEDKVSILSGLDGRKMSKSYNNTIPLFVPEKKLKKLINKIKTNSLEPGEAKDTESCTLFSTYKAFASEEQVAEIRQQYAEGIAWGEMKKILFEKINTEINPARERYAILLNDPEFIEKKLQEGAVKARTITVPFLAELRKAIGIKRFS